MSRTPATPPVAFETMLARFATSPTLTDLHGAMAKAVAEYKSAHDAVARIAGDKTLTDGARLVRQATVTRTVMGAALIALEKAQAATAAGRKNVEAALSKHLAIDNNLAAISLAAETRAHVKNLPAAERGRFLLSAIDAGEIDSLRAIAGTPAFLSGIPQQMHELARDHVLSVMAPDHVKIAKTLVEGEQFAENLHTQISHAVSNLVDFASADQIAKNAAA